MILGLDVGGTNIDAVAIEGQKIISKVKYPLYDQDLLEAILVALDKLLVGLLGQQRPLQKEKEIRLLLLFVHQVIMLTEWYTVIGTQDIYWNDKNTLFISFHQDGRTLFSGTGFIEELGGPSAYGYNLNIPLPPGTGEEGSRENYTHLYLQDRVKDEFYKYP